MTPNILLICTDQHRYDALACYGDPVVQTPTIDRLAVQGTLFERCYSPSPVCAPARASMLTGHYPHGHGLWANGVTFPSGHRLLGRILADAGYDTGLVGRMHLAACAGGRTEQRFDDGFRFHVWSNSPAQPSPDNSYHRWLAEHFPELWQREVECAAAAPERPAGSREVPGLCEDMPVEAHYSRFISSEAIRFLREERPAGQPFFLQANFYDPHHPFVAPGEYLDRYRQRPIRTPIRPARPEDGKPDLQRRLSDGESSYHQGFSGHSEAEIQDLIAAYYAMISMVDDEIARLLSTLDELGYAEDTLVILTSDHGEMLGDHGQLLKGPMFYEGAVRVPLILRWPGRVPAGVRVTGLVQSLDVFATCVAAAGLDPVPGCPSRDLVNCAVTDPTAGTRPYALTQYRNSGRPVEPPVDATMLRTDRHKLVAYHAGESSGELYDLGTDPEELTNLWHRPGYAGLRAELTERLLHALVATEDRTAPRVAPW